MARRKNSRVRTVYRKAKKHFHKKPTVSMAILGGFSVPVIQAVKVYQYAGPVNAFSNFTQNMTGFVPTTGKFNAGYMKQGLLPVCAGVLVHKVAGMLGINRMIAQAGIPLFRI
jgi:hypothetical protein